MSIQKRFFKSKPYCTVTFKLDKAAADSAAKAALIGEFNDWQPAATPMKKLKDGSFSASLNLEPGREYEFRYLLDECNWQNESDADGFAPTHYHDAENSVVRV